MDVLLSIKPQFANEIFSGTKKFEYRKAIFREKVSRVIVYASSPVQMVIGEFQIDEVLFEDLSDLWSQTRAHAGISESYFYSYFSHREKGYAIKIGQVIQYEEPTPLENVYSSRPPQSFAYIYS
jgi:predicted transcriptional regulator